MFFMVFTVSLENEGNLCVYNPIFPLSLLTSSDTKHFGPYWQAHPPHSL